MYEKSGNRTGYSITKIIISGKIIDYITFDNYYYPIFSRINAKII